jgi:tripartite-type tricarboxylate transporter receptor subunit TctC
MNGDYMSGNIFNTKFNFIFFSRILVLISCIFNQSFAIAQDKFPTQNITIIVGFPPGGSNDIVTRMIAPKLGEILGVSIIVENKPGANGTIGTDLTVKSSPNGYTLTLGSSNPMAVNPNTMKLPYNILRDLRPITTVAFTPTVLAINPNIPINNLSEFLSLSKTRPISIATSGNGSSAHLGIEKLKLETFGNFIHIPYKGAAPAMNDVTGGHVDAIIMDYPAILSLVKDGRLKIIAGLKGQEQGETTFIKNNWFAVMAPAKTTDKVIQILFDGFVKTMNEPDVKAQLNKIDFYPFLQESPAATLNFIKNETTFYGNIVKKTGLKFE